LIQDVLDENVFVPMTDKKFGDIILEERKNILCIANFDGLQ